MCTRNLLCSALLVSVCAVGLAGCERAPQGAAPSTSTTAAGRPSQAAAAPAPSPGAAELARGKRAYGETDPARALGFFLEAARKGNAEAQYYAGLMLADGQGVAARDVNAAAKLYAQAAAQGQPDAAYQLARLHVLGVGVVTNIPRAIELFDQAARKFPPGAQRDLAIEQRDALRALGHGEPAPRTAEAPPRAR